MMAQRARRRPREIPSPETCRVIHLARRTEPGGGSRSFAGRGPVKKSCRLVWNSRPRGFPINSQIEPGQAGMRRQFDQVLRALARWFYQRAPCARSLYPSSLDAPNSSGGCQPIEAENGIALFESGACIPGGQIVRAILRANDARRSRCRGEQRGAKRRGIRARAMSSAGLSYGGSRKMKSAIRRRFASLSRPANASASISSAPKIPSAARFSRISFAAFSIRFDEHRPLALRG